MSVLARNGMQPGVQNNLQLLLAGIPDKHTAATSFFPAQLDWRRFVSPTARIAVPRDFLYNKTGWGLVVMAEPASLATREMGNHFEVSTRSGGAAAIRLAKLTKDAITEGFMIVKSMNGFEGIWGEDLRKYCAL